MTFKLYVERAFDDIIYIYIYIYIYLVPRNKSRKRNINWFNPPFSTNTRTNVGRTFLELVNKHFPVGHTLYKLFNKSTIKVRYGCTENMVQIIQRHNKKILNQDNTVKEKLCNSRKKEECPLKGSSLKENLVYQATVKHLVAEGIERAVFIRM